MRSKNHLLFELFLEQLGAEYLFDKTKHLSLGHIVSYIDGDYEFPSEVTEYTNKDFSMSSSFKELQKLDELDFDILKSVISKIDEYHQSKKH